MGVALNVPADAVSGAPLVVYDAALLFESGRGELFRPVVVVTAYSSVESAITAMKEGAFHYVPKPCLLYTSPSPRDRTRSRMPSSA